MPIACYEVVEYLERCGGRDVLHVSWLKTPTQMFDAARALASSLREQYELQCAPVQVVAEGNRVILTLLTDA